LLLADPRTAAFISHVGLNSLNEAVYFGVPIVAVPFFGDQPMNAGMVLKRGNGVFVSRKNVSAMPGALAEILSNKK
jgi:UDP:flavonoid glycosyltransferase YjiC (YdhE family)